MKKSKLMMEAINAFTKKYDELPADAGWPVVKEWRKQVYFARSLADWGKYKKGQQFLTFIFLMVGMLTVAAIITVVLGLYWVSLALSVAYFVLLIFAVIFHQPKRGDKREILNYVPDRKKIVKIAL